MIIVKQDNYVERALDAYFSKSSLSITPMADKLNGSR